MKSFTDLPQSKKLAEILPLESADMCFNISVRKNMPPLMIPYSRFDEFFNISPAPDFLIPCWSLAALLSVLPSVIKRNSKRKFLTLEKAGAYNLYYKSPDRLDEFWETKEEPVDACYEMINKLHELKML